MRSLMSLVVLALATSCASSGSSPDPGIAPAIDDPTTGRFGNTDFSKMRKLGTEPISRYLNCGDSIMGPAADTYRVYISLISQVHPDGKGETDFETSFVAQARNMEGTTSDRVACGTTGRLEEHIRLRLIEKLNSSNG